MTMYSVEIRQSLEKIPNGLSFSKSHVTVNASSHEEAKSIAESRHQAMVLSTEEIQKQD